MRDYNKKKIKEQITDSDIYELLSDWGGEPEYTDFGFLSATICHNMPGEGSRKLYYYTNTALFKCYTGCEDSSFDIFDLTIKVHKNQFNVDLDLNQAILYLVKRFNLIGHEIINNEFFTINDWNIINYLEQRHITAKEKGIAKPYDKPIDEKILERFSYLRIKDWEDEGISSAVIKAAKIGYYPGGEQITIPHYNEYGKLIGIRGRSLITEEGERYGKYRPININGHFYKHALGLNLYNLNHSKEQINNIGKCFVFESEKSCLKYRSYFGEDNDISVAICGSSISLTQINFMMKYGAKEIIIGLDRQFKELNDKEHKMLVKKLKGFYNKYKNLVNISFLFDKDMITDYKASPIDHGPDIFLQLYKERIIL